VGCKTVDGFQGQECDLVIFLCVRSNKEGRIGFLADERRLNVAITRPKYSLLIIGDRETLSANPMWRDLISAVAARSPVLSILTSPLLRQVVGRYRDDCSKLDSMKRSIDFDAFSDSRWQGKLHSTQAFTNSVKKLSGEDWGRLVLKVKAIANGNFGRSDRNVGEVDEVLVDIASTASIGINTILVWSLDLEVSQPYYCHSLCNCLLP
jgi:hypothetical protein